MQGTESPRPRDKLYEKLDNKILTRLREYVVINFWYRNKIKLLLKDFLNTNVLSNEGVLAKTVQVLDSLSYHLMELDEKGQPLRYSSRLKTKSAPKIESFKSEIKCQNPGLFFIVIHNII